MGAIKKLTISAILLSVLIYSGCSSNKQIKIKYPKWFNSTPPDTHMFYYGLGEGDSKNNAATNALNEIASKISTSISSIIDTNTIANIGANNKKTYKKMTQRNIINEVEKIRFNDYQVVSYKKMNKLKHIVLVRIDRMKNARLMTSKIENKLNSYKNTINNKNTNIIQNLKTYSKIYQDIDNTLIPKYFTAQSLYKGDIDSKNILQQLLSLKIKINKYKNNVTFNVYSKNKNTANYANTITSYVNKLGYTVAKNKKNVVNIEVSHTEEKISILDNFIFKLKLIITITAKNEIFKKQTIYIASKSKFSFNIAKTFAIKKLEKKLDLLSIL